MALTGKGVTTPTPWDWPVELSGDKKQNPTIPPGSCDGPTPAYTCGALRGGQLRRDRQSELWRRGVHRTRRGEADEGQERQAQAEQHRSATMVRWRLELKVPLKTRIQAGKALAEGKKVKAKVSVRARDAAGNVTTAKRTIKIVKGARSRPVGTTRAPRLSV